MSIKNPDQVSNLKFYNFHHTLGDNMPSTDIDHVAITKDEEGKTVPAFFGELKHAWAHRVYCDEQMEIMIYVANACKKSAFFFSYGIAGDPDLSDYKATTIFVFPLNEYAKAFLGGERNEGFFVSERDFYYLSCRLRRIAPNEAIAAKLTHVKDLTAITKHRPEMIGF
jgi:hypothetical protein